MHALPTQEGTGAFDGTLLCIKGVLLARHICEIDYRDARVTRVQVGFVD